MTFVKFTETLERHPQPSLDLVLSDGGIWRIRTPGKLDGPTMLAPKSSRLGRDVHGLYPGQLGRVHVVHSKDCGYNLHSGRSQSVHGSLQSTNPPCEDYQQSFDLRTLRALTVLRHSPAVPEQRPPQTTYQEQFGPQ